MTWTAPVTRATGYIVLASDWNNEHVNDLLYLHGDSGAQLLYSGGNSIAFGTQATPMTFFQFPQGAASAPPGNTATGVYIDSAGRVCSTSTAALYNFSAAVSTDTASKWGIRADLGRMEMGPGGSTAMDAFLSRTAPKVFYANAKVFESGNAQGSLTVPTTITPDLQNGVFLRFNITAGGANTLTIANPSNNPSSTQSSFMVIRIANTGGGTITLSWNAAFTALGSAFALPASVANGATSTTLWVFDGNAAKWCLLSVN